MSALLASVLLLSTVSVSAATATYRWQISNNQSYGGYTTNWSTACGAQPTAPAGMMITTMTTAAFACNGDRVEDSNNTPHDTLLLIKDSAYASSTLVTGQASGNRWYLRAADNNAHTFRFALGYAQGGTFTPWGTIDVNVPGNSEQLYQPDMSSISGTAPAGSHLALRLTKQTGGTNRARIYFADGRNNGDQSGQLFVDETVSCTPSGSLSISSGQTLSGDPIDLTGITTVTNATNVVYTVTDGNCTSAGNFDQLDNFTGLANGTRPNFGNWTGVQGSDGTLGWVALSGGTASGTTGPASGNPDPYVYLESSATGQTYGVGVTAGSSQYVQSNILDASVYDLSFTFDWNMNVNDNTNASLHLDAWNGSSWDLDVNGSTINTGNNGDTWVTTGPVVLSAYSNSDFRLRIRYIVGTGTIWQNDVAIDNLHVTGTPKITTLFTGNATQAASVDTTGWTDGTKCLTVTGDDASCGTPLTQAQDTFNFVTVVNIAPTVNISTPINGSSFASGASVTFSGTASDPEDGNLTASLSWSSSLDGVIGSGGSFSTSTLSVGTHTITASVTDSGGKTGQAQITITINANNVPVVTITSPTNGASFNIGTTVSFAGTATDAEDGGLTGSLSWSSSLDGVIGSGGSFSTSALSAGTHTITASVTDSGGATGQAQITITIRENRVIPGTPSGNIDACDRITVYAPYTGDFNANSTTAFQRGPTSTGPWATVCGSVSGASPRTCVDTGVSELSTYYYRITFTDPDGISGSNPPVLGPLSTPACTVDNTTTGTASASVSSCSQITVTAPFTGDGNLNGSVKVEYNTTNSWPGTTACAAVGGVSPRTCLVTGLSASTAYYIRVTYSDPDGVTGTAVQVLPGTYTTTVCSGNGAAPTITFLSPTKNGTVGGTDRFLVQIWDADGVTTANVRWGLDGANPTTAVAVASNYNCNMTGQTNCVVYSFDVDTTALSTGKHYVTVQATDSAGSPSVARLSWPFKVSNSGGAPTGSGNLLRRTHGSQLCIDCHNLATHSSQATSSQYGNWSQECLTCHIPHDTTNIALIRPQIETPSSGIRDVDFRNKTGKADFSYATVTSPGQGVCEVCHTKTENIDGTPRFRNSGGSDGGKHYSSKCTGCHIHPLGFKAGESEGGATCAGCHPDIWDGMNGTVAKTSRHGIGSLLGTNDAFTDSGLTWASPLSNNAAAARSCLNMCHNDHPHTLTSPSTTTHQNSVYLDSTSSATRAAGSKTSADKDDTDFDAAATNGGLCISCHRNTIGTTSGSRTTGVTISKAAYDVSAHDFVTNGFGTWTYTLHDGSKFNRNCTKCHSDGDSAPDASTIPFGAVHYSSNERLLSGTLHPNGTAANFTCYGCHGDGATGSDYSGKRIAPQIAKTSRHPANNDNVHDSEGEYNSASFGNQLGGRARHSSCMDCHDPHKAKSGLHTPQTNLAGPSLEGAWGAQLSTNPNRWAVPTSANFTKKVIVAGTDLEATLCFKCHSSYYGTLPNSPSGGFQETDTAREFNPNNTSSGSTAGSFHPVLASAGNNLGATSNIKAPWTRTSVMTCTDCHASDTTTDPGGPHGSAAGFLLKGPNTAWNSSISTQSGGMPNGTFCINCHNQNFSSSRFTQHASRSDHRIQCFNCHSAIPHGTARPGLLVALDSSPYGDKTTDTAPWRQMPNTSRGLYIKNYPSNNTQTWQEANCGCGSANH